MKKLICLLLATTSLYAAPQTVVFDFGGVMTNEQNREAVVKFLCASFHLIWKNSNAFTFKMPFLIKPDFVLIEMLLDFIEF